MFWVHRQNFLMYLSNSTLRDRKIITHTSALYRKGASLFFDDLLPAFLHLCVGRNLLPVIILNFPPRQHWSGSLKEPPWEPKGIDVSTLRLLVRALPCSAETASLSAWRISVTGSLRRPTTGTISQEPDAYCHALIVFYNNHILISMLYTEYPA